MKLIAVFVVSWIAGLVAYLATLAIVYGEASGAGDLVAVVFWSLIAYATAFVLCYLPAMFGLRRLLGGVEPLWLFAAVAVTIGVLPVTLIAMVNGGGDLKSLLSAEARLFFTMFAAIGVVAGSGFALIHRRKRAS